MPGERHAMVREELLSTIAQLTRPEDFPEGDHWLLISADISSPTYPTRPPGTPGTWEAEKEDET